MTSKGLPRGGPLFFAAALVAAATAAAGELAGEHPVRLHARDGSSVVIGHVVFDPAADGRIRFAFKLDTAPFSDHFLSMREFKCLPGQGEILCHVPYPYPQPGTVAADDLAWLEHSLLFMFKRPSEFGARLWNGVYWKLRRQGEGFVGTPQAVDLNLIGAPPDKPGAPYRPALRDDMPAGARWFEKLTIE
jgi:hypothetical protein